MTVDLRTLNRSANWFRRLPLRQRFEMSYEATEAGCWEWLGSRSTRGYGQFKYGPRPQRAHRVAYMLFVGPIPDGMTLDHLCRNKLCVNPEHLEVVTRLENHRRWAATISACIRGHEFTPETTYTDPTTGWRSCVTCRHLRRAGLTDDGEAVTEPPMEAA